MRVFVCVSLCVCTSPATQFFCTWTSNEHHKFNKLTIELLIFLPPKHILPSVFPNSVNDNSFLLVAQNKNLDCSLSLILYIQSPTPVVHIFIIYPELNPSHYLYSSAPGPSHSFLLVLLQWSPLQPSRSRPSPFMIHSLHWGQRVAFTTDEPLLCPQTSHWCYFKALLNLISIPVAF